MNHFNFKELMCKVDTFSDLNTKQLLLYEARAIYEQNALYADDYLMQIKSAFFYLQKERELLPITFFRITNPAKQLRVREFGSAAFAPRGDVVNFKFVLKK